MKGKLALLLCIAIILATMLPVTAYARGGHGRGGVGRLNQSATPRFALCLIDDCEIYGRHAHDGNWYCNQNGVNRENYAVCTREECDLLGLHEHDGTWYHSADYPYGSGAGFCGRFSRNPR